MLLGAESVRAVEINPLIVSLVRERFDRFAGGLYNHPKVDVRIENGRAHVDRAAENFDVIQASLVDTWAASANGAFTLTENHLYTLEAFQSYLDHLEPGGYLSVSRWHHDPPRESLRLLGLGTAALSSRGAAAPLSHLAVAFQSEIANFLFCRDPLTDDQKARLRAEAEAAGFELVFGGDPAPPDAGLLRRALHQGVGSVTTDLPWDLSPPIDDRPFFFHTVRGADYLSLPWRAFTGDLRLVEEVNAQAVWVVLRLLWIATIAAVVLIFGPLLMARKRLGKLTFGIPLVYFSTLGLAFVFIATGNVGRLSVRFGSPTWAFVTLTFTTLLGASLGAAWSTRLERKPRERPLRRPGRDPAAHPHPRHRQPPLPPRHRTAHDPAGPASSASRSPAASKRSGAPASSPGPSPPTEPSRWSAPASPWSSPSSSDSSPSSTAASPSTCSLPPVTRYFRPPEKSRPWDRMGHPCPQGR